MMQPHKTKKILLLGDSLSAGFPYKEIQDYQILNLAVNGDETIDLLKRLPYIRFKDVDAIFLEIGINDLLRDHKRMIDRNAEDILNNISQILDHVTKNMLQNHIYLESIYPVTQHEKYVKQDEIEIINAKIKALNSNLEILALSNHVHFVNMYQSLESDQKLSSQYTTDGIHLNQAGYEIVYKTIKKTLNI